MIGMRKIVVFFHVTECFKLCTIRRSPGERILRGLFLSVFALHRDRTEELYFITLVLIRLLVRPHGILGLFLSDITAQSNLNLLIINSYLFYDCFYSCFAFYGYYYDTCRSREGSVVGRKNCVSDCLAKNVADSNFLTSCTVDNNCTFLSNY